MFTTRPEGELFIPKELTQGGERSWWWVEFGLCLPYLLIALRTGGERGDFLRHVLTSRVEDLVNLAACETPDFRIHQVQLLSPHYMNGAADYQLSVVRQIWWNAERKDDVMFVMADGERQFQSADGNQPAEDTLILAFDWDGKRKRSADE